MYLYAGMNLINSKLENIEQTPVSESEDIEMVDDDDQFCAVTRKKSSESELKQFLDSSSDELSIYSRFPKLRRIFIELNTPLPASAACERLFSCAGLIFRPHRSSIKDENFENSLLIKLNKKFV